MRKQLRTASAVISAALIRLGRCPVFEATPQTVSCLVTTANGDVQGTRKRVFLHVSGHSVRRTAAGQLTLEAAAAGCAMGAGHAECDTARQCPQINPAGSTTTVGQRGLPQAEHLDAQPRANRPPRR